MSLTLPERRTGSPSAPTTASAPPTSRGPVGGVAEAARPLLHALLGDPLPVRIEFWDGTGAGPDDGPGTLSVRSPDVFRHLLWAPGELGLGRAFVTGQLDVDGDIFEVLSTLRDAVQFDGRAVRTLPAVVRSARAVGALGRPLPHPPEEATPRGRRHSKGRDAAAISHHYDVGNDFYDIVLGPAMTYSCARFTTPEMDLADAQAAKHELICRKLGLHERSGMRLLDVGCGWGSLALHAAHRHRATVVGVTISQAQVERARARVEAAGLTGQVEIRLQDYRDLAGEQFDAISSVGMFEHVGVARTEEYFTTLRALLPDHGRLLNHAISSVAGSRLSRHSFAGRYVFPDGELLDVGDVVLAMERAGFEVRDVESLREHYARTLRAWVENLEARWDDAVALVGEPRARVWRLYMAASAVGFTDGGLGLHQVLGVVPAPDGSSGMPATRRHWD
ncbi:MAG: class I SAM-dependent methyltransferase [Actinomycetota bacterium]|nr:class I SAM-dependent methyltransferase [Actinomycetota bacterium]